MDNSNEQMDLIAIIGPTASGKTTRAVQLATHINGEIISCDSRQVYRRMDVGTGKDLDEYGDVPYHLIDICNAGEKYNLYKYLSDYENVYSSILERRRYPILCGGTGLYAESVLSGIKLPHVPENIALRQELQSKSIVELKGILEKYKTLHNTTDIDSTKRAIRAIEIEQYYSEHPQARIEAKKSEKYRSKQLIIGVNISREDRRRRITERLYSRFNNGLIEEVEALISSGVTPDDLIYYGLEYKFVTQYVIGLISQEQMLHDLEIAIHQFAKRQMTWFRGMERRGFIINWIDYDISKTEFLDIVDCLIKKTYV